MKGHVSGTSAQLNKSIPTIADGRKSQNKDVVTSQRSKDSKEDFLTRLMEKKSQIRGKNY